MAWLAWGKTIWKSPLTERSLSRNSTIVQRPMPMACPDATVRILAVSVCRCRRHDQTHPSAICLLGACVVKGAKPGVGRQMPMACPNASVRMRLQMDWFLSHFRGNRTHCDVDDSAIWRGSPWRRLFGRALALRRP